MTLPLDDFLSAVNHAESHHSTPAIYVALCYCYCSNCQENCIVRSTDLGHKKLGQTRQDNRAGWFFESLRRTMLEQRTKDWMNPLYRQTHQCSYCIKYCNIASPDNSPSMMLKHGYINVWGRGNVRSWQHLHHNMAVIGLDKLVLSGMPAHPSLTAVPTT